MTITPVLVYASVSPAVNVNNRSPFPAHARTHDETAPMLPASAPAITALPLDLDEIVDFLSGRLVRLHGWKHRWCDVLRAFLSHLNHKRADNRAWAGIPTIAAESATSDTTVKRVKRALLDLGVSVVRGDELTEGAGPHKYQGAKRGKLDTDTIDFSPLLSLLPPALLDVFRAFLDAAAPPVQDVATAPQNLLYDENDPRTWSDPFTEQAALTGSAVGESPASAAGGGVRGEALSKTASPDTTALDAPKGDTLSTSGVAPCNVAIDKKTPAAKISRPVKVAGDAFNSPKLASIVVGDDRPGCAALVGVGVWLKTARQICADPDKGDAWAFKLAHYIKWYPNVESSPGGLARRTWKQFEGWPTWFEERFEREQAAANRAARSAGLVARAAPAVQPPARPAPAEGAPRKGEKLADYRRRTAHKK